MKNEWKELPVTYSLLLVTILWFLIIQVRFFGESTSSLAIFESGGMFGRVLESDSSQLWRLMTPIFVHIGWQHFITNIVSLYILGQMLERFMGRLRFFSLYLLSGIMGNVFTFFFTPDVVAAGASSSLFGCSAALVVFGNSSSNALIKDWGKFSIVMIGVNLLLGFLLPDIGWAGHIGGLVGGFLVAMYLNQPAISIVRRIVAVGVYVLLVLGLVVIRLL